MYFLFTKKVVIQNSDREFGNGSHKYRKGVEFEGGMVVRKFNIH